MISGTVQINGRIPCWNGPVVQVNATYEVSTIPNQTVLFKIDGHGPEQIDLNRECPNPSSAAMLAAQGQCYLYGMGS